MRLVLVGYSISCAPELCPTSVWGGQGPRPDRGHHGLRIANRAETSGWGAVLDGTAYAHACMAWVSGDVDRKRTRVRRGSVQLPPTSKVPPMPAVALILYPPRPAAAQLARVPNTAQQVAPRPVGRPLCPQRLPQTCNLINPGAGWELVCQC
jgi:hypothetical protein